MNGVQALIIVDVQVGFVTGSGAVPGAEPLVACVAGLLAWARRAGSLVVHLQNDGPPGAIDEPGTPGWALRLTPQPDEPVIRKAHDDGFRDTDLGRVLARRGVGRLAVAGLLSEMCVSATARAALDRGLEVVVPPGLGPAVPAAIVARVAERALGDQVELAPGAGDVAFASGQLRHRRS